MGRGFASLGSTQGSLFPVCFVLTPYGRGGTNRSAILLECLAVCPPSNSSLCVSPHTPTTYAHTKLIYTFTNTRTQMDLSAQAYSSTLTCAPTVWNIHSCTREHTLTRALSLSLTHTPLVLVFAVRVRQSAVYTLSLSLFPAAVPSLQSLFHSKQNKMKSSTDLI